MDKLEEELIKLNQDRYVDCKRAKAYIQVLTNEYKVIYHHVAMPDEFLTHELGYIEEKIKKYSPTEKKIEKEIGTLAENVVEQNIETLLNDFKKQKFVTVKKYEIA